MLSRQTKKSILAGLLVVGFFTLIAFWYLWWFEGQLALEQSGVDFRNEQMFRSFQRMLQGK